MPFLAPVATAIIGGGWVTQLLVGTALTIGGTLLSQALAPKPKQIQQRDPGVNLTMRVGGDSPLSFFVGTAATAGHRVYANSWGTDGETPNAFLVDVLELSNAPLEGLSAVYVNGERATILTGSEHAQYGYPIQQGRKGGKDHLWVKFYDGRQTSADPYLVSKFGGHAERPYGSDRIGFGNSYAIVTTRYNRELWKSGAPKMLLEVRGSRLYDIRKDSTAGGSGSHRRDNPATWEWTENPYVIGYNAAFMGVYVGDEWLWGLQNLPALRLPMSAWVAAMNEADRTLAAWDNQKQFTIGGEITVDMEPAAVLDEIAKSSMGRFIESAGSYKPRCGAPGTSIYSFGEADLLITEPRTITPFPGLEGTHNTVEASYVEPGEAWGWKPAPTKTNAAYIAADGNRKLPAGLRFPMVSRNEQVQRLTYSFLEDGRRFRQFRAGFHPITWLLEPGDVIDGTLLSEGYDGKQFEILEMSGRRTFVQTMTLREIDPADFDPPESAKQDWSVGTIATIYPPAQPATGVSFAPYIFYDNEAKARRPAIEAFYQGAMDDIEWFRVQIKRPADDDPFFDAKFSYNDEAVSAAQPIFSQSFVQNMAVLARGKYVPFGNSRETEWTEWLTVTLPDVPEITDVDVDQLGRELQGAYGLITGTSAGSIQSQLAELHQLADQLAAALWSLDNNVKQSLDILSVQTDAGAAAVIETKKALVEATRAFAQQINEIIASIDENIAGGMLKMEAEVNEEESVADILFKVRAIKNGLLSQSAMMMRASVGSGGQTEALIALLADKLFLMNEEGDLLTAPFIVSGDTVTIDKALIRDLTAENIDVDDIFAQNASITGTLSVGPGIRIQGGSNRILIVDNT